MHIPKKKELYSQYSSFFGRFLFCGRGTVGLVGVGAGIGITEEQEIRRRSQAKEEIRHKHGANIFEIDYKGKEEDIKAALAERCEIMETATSPTGFNKIKVHVASDKDLRGVIAAANESVEMRSFREIIPSMNDIFIRAVNGNL